MQLEAIKQKIQKEIIARKFPEMSDAQVTEQTYLLAAGTLRGGRPRGPGGVVGTSAGSMRHQFVYQKQFGEGETVLHQTVIVVTDDNGEVQRVFRSR